MVPILGTWANPRHEKKMREKSSRKRLGRARLVIGYACFSARSPRIGSLNFSLLYALYISKTQTSRPPRESSSDKIVTTKCRPPGRDMATIESTIQKQSQ